MLKCKKYILAFSLIEVSIVLIIIGLLIAGVTGGASLIESAKIRNFIATTREWQNDVYTFYSLKNRLPGNPKNLSFLGQMINKNWNFNVSGIFSEYKISDFGISKVLHAADETTNTGIGTPY